MPRTIWLWAAAGVLLCPLCGRSEGLPEAKLTAEAGTPAIAALIDQLDWPLFVDRQSASQQLEEAGAAAISQLEAAAVSASREASIRAMDILKRHLSSGADELKAAARAVLTRLAESTSASTAQRARDALKPAKELSTPLPIGFQPVVLPPPRNNFGAILLNPGGIRRVSVSEINGRKLFELDERERNVKFETAPTGRIFVEVTDKRTSRKRILDAKDADELQRRDAELGRLYDQYYGAGRRQLGGPAGGGAGGAPPFGLGRPVNPLPPAAGAINRQIENVDLLIERYKGRLPNDPLAQRMIDLLEQTRQQYKAMLPAGDARRAAR